MKSTYFQNMDFPASRWHSRGQRFDPAYLQHDALGYDVGKSPDFGRNQDFFFAFWREKHTFLVRRTSDNVSGEGA